MILPILHRIIVRQDKLEEKDETFKRAKSAGLIVEFDEKKREQAAIDTGTVVKIGSTAFRDFGADSPVEIGDYVVFAKHAGKTIVDPEDKDTVYVALNDEDIICKLIGA